VGAASAVARSWRRRWSSRSIRRASTWTARSRPTRSTPTASPVTGIDVEPATVHVQIPLFTDKESRTLPVNPVISGSPARASGSRRRRDPATVTVEGDAEQLTTLIQVDTAPVSVAGATADVTQSVALAPPNGISTTSAGSRHRRGDDRADHADPHLQRRAPARRPDASLSYDLSTDQVLLTLFGSVADLDQLAAGPLVVGLNVGGLGVGEHDVTVVPVIPSGVEVVTIDPEQVTVTVTAAGASTPAPATPPPAATGEPVRRRLAERVPSATP
jgi:YbbR domain-containing protein